MSFKIFLLLATVFVVLLSADSPLNKVRPAYQSGEFSGKALRNVRNHVKSFRFEQDEHFDIASPRSSSCGFVWLKAGSQCDTDSTNSYPNAYCGLGLTCASDNTCHHEKTDGCSCSSSSECDNECYQGVCVDGLPTGQPCSSSGDCNDDNYCNSGTCAARTGEGTACSKSESCVDDLYCNSTNVCAQQMADGSACTSSSQCRNGGCVNDKCNMGRSGIAGDKCTETDDCQNGLVCSPSGSSNVCANEPPTCSTSNDCSNNAFCKNGSCCDYWKPCLSEEKAINEKCRSSLDECKKAYGAYYCCAFADQPDFLASINVNCCIPEYNWDAPAQQCCSTSDFCSKPGSCSSSGSKSSSSSSSSPGCS